MNLFVLDNSVAISWLLKSEKPADAVIRRAPISMADPG